MIEENVNRKGMGYQAIWKCEGKRIFQAEHAQGQGGLKELTHFAKLQGIQPVWSSSCLFWGPGMEEVRWCTRPLLEDHTLVERWGAGRLLRDHKWFGLSEGREGEELKEKRAWNPGLKQMELFLVSGEESWTDQKNNCLKIFICKNSHVVKPAFLGK